jgi:hypothetical protein
MLAEEISEQQQRQQHANPNSLTAKTGICLERPPFCSRGFVINNGNTLGARVRRFLFGQHVNPHQSLFWMGS